MFRLLFLFLFHMHRQFLNPVIRMDLAPNVQRQYELTETVRSYSGIASYYSRAGCVGCRDDLLMANGQPLNDNKKSLAFNREPLGTVLRVTNENNDTSVIAEVTDTGGFERLGRIADLSLATKKSIGCNDLCRVKIEVIK